VLDWGEAYSAPRLYLSGPDSTKRHQPSPALVHLPVAARRRRAICKGWALRPGRAAVQHRRPCPSSGAR